MSLIGSTRGPSINTGLRLVDSTFSTRWYAGLRQSEETESKWDAEDKREVSLTTRVVSHRPCKARSLCWQRLPPERLGRLWSCCVCVWAYGGRRIGAPQLREFYQNRCRPYRLWRCTAAENLDPSYTHTHRQQLIRYMHAISAVTILGFLTFSTGNTTHLILGKRLTFHCWLYTLYIIVYVTNKNLESWILTSIQYLKNSWYSISFSIPRGKTATTIRAYIFLFLPLTVNFRAAQFGEKKLNCNFF